MKVLGKSLLVLVLMVSFLTAEDDVPLAETSDDYVLVAETSDDYVLVAETSDDYVLVAETSDDYVLVTETPDDDVPEATTPEDDVPAIKTINGVPVVKTLHGQISGVKEKSTHGREFYSYLSIPFAEPPLGKLRFKDPVKGTGWEGVRDGSKYSPVCLQNKYLGMGIGDSDQLGTEDCLYLNIFTSKPNEESALLPVMVFIHGGGFLYGGSEDCNPHALLNHDIVLVTIQYRLGLLGFFSTEDEEAPGNLGLKDQTMALSWIQTNCHLFGGNPLNITIFGESAGAGSVHYQILSPKSLGFFKRAILQSGSALCSWALGGPFKEAAEYTAKTFLCNIDEEMNEGKDEGKNDRSRQIISCLQKIPAPELIHMQKDFNVWLMNPVNLGPRVDGDFVPMDPAQMMMEGRHKKIDIMSGVTTHEGAFITIPMFAIESFLSSLKENFVEIGPTSLEFDEGDVSPLNQTNKIFDYYVGGAKIDAEHADQLTKMYTDRYFSVCQDMTASLHAKNTARHKKKVFSYEFSYRGQRSLFFDTFKSDIGKNYVGHADDLLYLFSNMLPLQTEEDLAMRDIITTLWTNFAAYGDPTPDDSLGFKWDPVTEDSLVHLNLKLSPTMEDDTRAEAREFWASLPLKQNLILYPDCVSSSVHTTLEETEGEVSKDKEKIKKQEEKKSENVENKQNEL